MADTKISALPTSTTPLAGTEVLPIVQGGVTKQVSVANLTAGRAVSAASVTASTGNFVVGTSGQGVDFSATPGTGTSELLNDYEEGTWTPIAIGTTTAGTCTYVFNTGSYTKVGRLVYFQMELFYTDHTGTGNLQINGLPFTVATSGTAIANPSGLVFSNNLVIVALSGGTALVPFTYASDASRAFLPMDASAVITVSGTYSV
jgi:hypothetical protein